MPTNADSLRELHRIHRQQTDLRSRLERGPKKVRAIEMKVEQIEALHKGLKEQFTRTRITSDDKQLQLKEREDRIANLNAKLNSAASNKEFQALKEQIAADEQADSVLSDEILEILEKLDQMQEQLATVTSQLEESRGELETMRKSVAEQQGGLESELGRVLENLVKAEAYLPADVKVSYKRIVAARGEEALAEVQAECCGSCYQTLTPQMMNELLMDKLVTCKTCGALLYAPEDRSI